MYHFEPLTAFLDNEAENFCIPARSMLIMKDGKEIYRHYAGYADTARTRSVTGDDLYWIYSATKVSTCTGALRLIEEGKLGLDDPVSKYLPKFANLTVKQEDGSVTPAKNVMTVRHLMSMQGGLDYDMHRGDIDAVIKEKGEDAGTVDIVNTFPEAPLIFEPGTHFQYSLCHDVLAAVIEVASGMRYSDYLKKVIFDPLGMKDTTFHPTEEQLSRVSARYQYSEESHVSEPVDPNRFQSGIPEKYESGGGGILSSLNDYILLGAALANKGTGLNGYQLLKPETVELFRTPQLGEDSLADYHRDFLQCAGYSYGLGVRVFTDDRNAIAPVGHFGWDGAAGFYLMIDPDTNVSYVYAQHVMSSTVTFHHIHRQIRDLAYFCMREEKLV